MGTGMRLGAAAAAIAIAAVVSSVVLVISKTNEGTAQSDPQGEPSPTPTVSFPPGPPPPDPSTLVWPTDPPTPTPTVPPPQTIVVKGKEVHLGQGVVAGPPPIFFDYSPESDGITLWVQMTWMQDGDVWRTEPFLPRPGSFVALDKNGDIVNLGVKSEDLWAFQELIDAAGPPPLQSVVIGGRQVQLAPWMWVSEGNGLYGGGQYFITYKIPGRPWSSMVITPDGRIIKENVAPEAEEVFRPIREAAQAAQTAP